MEERHEERDETEDRWEMITTSEAANALCYNSVASFRRAWRREGLPLYPQPGGRRWLVAVADVEKFLGPRSISR